MKFGLGFLRRRRVQKQRVNNPVITMHRDGLLVDVRIIDTDDGPMIRLEGQNCHLEGIAPGDYLLTPTWTD